MGEVFGYIRVSSRDQNPERQIKSLGEEMRIKEGNLYVDKMSGKNTKRPNLIKMMDYVRKGDTVMVTSISRFARNTMDLLELVNKLKEKEVKFISMKEAIDTTTPAGEFMLTVFGAIAQLERAYIRDRQKEGIAVALKKGVKFGRTKIEIDDLFIKAYKQWEKEEITAVKAMKLCGMTRSTFYRRAEEYRQGEKKC